MQLYRIKYEKAGLFEKVKYAVHLPQYLSFILTSSVCTDITSVGCHTNMWHFQGNRYHDWIKAEGIGEKLPALVPCTDIAGHYNEIPVGCGLHDSSAALIPYLASFSEPFILLSTGTWCISLNPFNHSLLTNHELRQDCLCYLSYEGKPVKASRLFAGYEHEQQVKRLSEHFGQPVDYYKTVECDSSLLARLQKSSPASVKKTNHTMIGQSAFGNRDLNSFEHYEEAYHQLIMDLIRQQVESTQLVLSNSIPVKRIFVDGGFSKNPIFMFLLAGAFPDIEVYAASVAQASAMGAALAIHPHWNPGPLPSDIIDLRLYTATSHRSI